MFLKFPSTPYIEMDKKLDRKDKILNAEEITQILSCEVRIEEKIDGANLGISFNDEGKLLLQNRGSYLYPPLEGQWKILSEWIKIYEEAMFDFLSDKYILFGEWCYVTHSIYYDALPDWFIGFDIYDKEMERFLAVEKRNQIMSQVGISIVPELGKGIFNLGDFKHYFGKSRFGSSLCEGIYLRQDEGDFLKYRAKIVRKDFQQNIDIHWSKKEVRHNKILF